MNHTVRVLAITTDNLIAGTSSFIVEVKPYTPPTPTPGILPGINLP